MTNQNGQLILTTLQNLDEPATVMKVAMVIASKAGLHPNDLKDSVEETLNGGVRYGFIQRQNRKYYAAPIAFEELLGSGDDEDNDDPDNDVEQEGGSSSTLMAAASADIDQMEEKEPVVRRKNARSKSQRRRISQGRANSRKSQRRNSRR